MHEDRHTARRYAFARPTLRSMLGEESFITAEPQLCPVQMAPLARAWVA
jgi:hypothetical protein